MKIYFRLIEVVAYIFVHMLILAMPGGIMVAGATGREFSWSYLLVTLFFIFMLAVTGLSIKQLYSWYKKIPAVVLDSDGITISTGWTVKHIYWSQIKYIKMDGPQKATRSRNARFTFSNKNGTKTIKFNILLLDIEVDDLKWALHQYHKSPENQIFHS